MNVHFHIGTDVGESRVINKMRKGRRQRCAVAFRPRIESCPLHHLKVSLFSPFRMNDDYFCNLQTFVSHTQLRRMRFLSFRQRRYEEKRREKKGHTPQTNQLCIFLFWAGSCGRTLKALFMVPTADDCRWGEVNEIKKNTHSASVSVNTIFV